MRKLLLVLLALSSAALAQPIASGSVKPGNCTIAINFISKFAVPGCTPVTPLLNSLYFSDVNPQSPKRGSLMFATGQRPRWSQLFTGNPAQVLMGGTEPHWGMITGFNIAPNFTVPSINAAQVAAGVVDIQGSATSLGVPPSGICREQYNTTSGSLAYGDSTGTTRCGPALKPSATDQVYYASINGNDNNDGLSWGTAKRSLPAVTAAMGTNGTIYLGNGTFPLGTTTFSMGSALNIICAGRNNTSITYTGSGVAIAFGDGTTGVSNASIEKCNIDMTGAGSGAIAVQFNGSTADSTSPSIYNILRLNRIIGNGATCTGIKFLRTAWAIRLENNLIESCSAGIDVATSAFSSENLVFTGNIVGCGGIASSTGLNLHQSSGPIDSTIVGNEFNNCTTGTSITTNQQGEITYQGNYHEFNGTSLVISGNTSGGSVFNNRFQCTTSTTVRSISLISAQNWIIGPNYHAGTCTTDILNADASTFQNTFTNYNPTTTGYVFANGALNTFLNVSNGSLVVTGNTVCSSRDASSSNFAQTACLDATGGLAKLVGSAGIGSEIDIYGGATDTIKFINTGILNQIRQTFAAATTSASSYNIPSGTAPTTPVAGDVWVDTSEEKHVVATSTSGGIKIYDSGGTNSITDTSSGTITSYTNNKPLAAGSGVQFGNNSSNTITQSFSGDAAHAVSQLAKTAAVTTFTLCAATAGTACGQAGQYRISYNFYGSGTACSSVTAGSVGLNLTWTDTNAVAHTTISLPLWDQKSAAMTNGLFNFNTALGTEGASGDYIISTNGTIIQAATTYTACTTGTGTYNLKMTVEQLQ